MTNHYHLSVVLFISGLFSFSVLAQQHSARYNSAPLINCNKLAVYELKQCLSEFALDDNDHCWTDSHQAYQQCRFAINPPTDRKNHPAASKAQLKKIQQLSKRLTAKKINVYLMAAADMSVYKQIVEQARDNLSLMLQLEGVSDKQRKQSQSRLSFYQQLLSQVDQRVNCVDIKQNLKDFADSQPQDNFYASAYREVKRALPIYCRLLKK